MPARNNEMQKMCGALLAHYQANGEFTIEQCDALAGEWSRDTVRQRFYKALKAGYFQIADMPDGKRKHARYKPGPNIRRGLDGNTTDGKAHYHTTPVPDLCEFFGMKIPEDFDNYPTVHIYRKPWE